MSQRKIDKIFKDLPNVFGIIDNILVLGYDGDGKDHDDTLQRASTSMQTSEPQIKQRQMPFHMYAGFVSLAKLYTEMV